MINTRPRNALIALLSLVLPAQAFAIAAGDKLALGSEGTYHYWGLLGDHLEIEMTLKATEGKNPAFEGSYINSRNRKPIRLLGSIVTHASTRGPYEYLHLEELDAAGKQTGGFNFNDLDLGNMRNGEWVSADEKTKYPVSLRNLSQGELLRLQQMHASPGMVRSIFANRGEVFVARESGIWAWGVQPKILGLDMDTQGYGHGVKVLLPMLNLGKNVSWLNDRGGNGLCAVENGALLCQQSGYLLDTQNPPYYDKTGLFHIVKTFKSGVTQMGTFSEGNDVPSCVLMYGKLMCWRYQKSNLETVKGLEENVRFISKGRPFCGSVGSEIRCWGWDSYENWSSHKMNHEAKLVKGFPPFSSVSELVSGLFYSCALINGAVWCWGVSGSILGKGWNGVPYEPPTKIHGLESDVSEIAGGADHMCAVRSGEVLCWGLGTENENGALGRGLMQPTKIEGLPKNALSISTGDGLSCASFKDGSVWCWGARQREPWMITETALP